MCMWGQREERKSVKDRETPCMETRDYLPFFKYMWDTDQILSHKGNLNIFSKNLYHSRPYAGHKAIK